MKTILVLIMLAFANISLAMTPSTDNCEKYNKFVNLTTKTLAVTLNCRSEVAIRYDVDRLGKRMGFCQQADDKGLVCTIVSKAGVYAVQRQIPIQWLCKPDIAMKVLEMSLNKTCESITGL